MILDTSYLLALLEHDEAAFDMGMTMYERSVPARVSVTSVFELFYGAALTLDDEERRQVRNVLMGYPWVPIDDEIARLAAEMVAAADRDAGGPEQSGVEDNDAYIGATARAYSEPVLTRNDADFEKLGVDVETF
ncbi:PIN domain-containing protein [Halegenticoccus tardaugens]|uniref:PIN domain-containing protein n=1 Tax=Halegenticoccus tardaugens TaxID=2071624 RepID=UPI00100BFDB6|nr:PIN domain-containing protein [Halegenticoccus tardaugens]